MSRSLGIALSGMKANQQWIDLIGNNLANSNTPGFKSMRGTFSTSFAQTLRFASAPRGTLGGRNAVQIGLGASGMETDRTFSQGALTGTGRIFDLALEGDGFFALQGTNRRMFTRVGTFGLDLNHMLVDQGSGFPVLDGLSLRVDEGDRIMMSYPQVDGACGLMFMKVWTIDAETFKITKYWLPVAVVEESDGIEAREILGIGEELFIFINEGDFTQVFTNERDFEEVNS